jgi:Fic family protein
MYDLRPLTDLSTAAFETPVILKRLATAGRALAELKGIAETIPQPDILVNALGLQEAKDSSAIENIVTTHDAIYQDAAQPENRADAAAKEVLRYRQALWIGFEAVKESGLLTNRHILSIQAELVQNDAGFRRLPGTELKDGSGRTIYTPPQDHKAIVELMRDLEHFINVPESFDADPLIKMALIHHQFESIHPFYDGNGRTGRIINVLYLVKEGLLDIPALYLSRSIVNTKEVYYRLLQVVRTDGAWEEWVLYILTCVEETARAAIATTHAIRETLLETKHRVRESYKFYSHDLINNLFTHPYTKIEFVEKDLGVSRLTATKYLDELARGGFLEKKKVGRTNYYVNRALYAILAGADMQSRG